MTIQSLASTLLPVAAGRFVRRRLTEAMGVLLIASAAALVAALTTYSPADPSFNHATRAAAGNALGAFGAYLADAMIHGFGWTSAIPALVLAAYGARLVSHRSIRTPWARLSAAIASVPLLATAFAALPALASWPLATGLGGIVGQMSLTGGVHIVDRLGAPHGALIVPLVALFLGTAVFSAAVGLSWTFCAGATRSLALRTRVVTHGLQSVYRRASATVRGAMSDDPLLASAAMPGARSSSPETVKPEKGPTPTDIDVLPKTPRVRTSKKAATSQAELDFGSESYRFPPLDLLHKIQSGKESIVNRDGLEQNARLLATVLEDFGVRGTIVRVRPGPVITLYELEPAPGTKTARVIGLADDIARSMSAVSVRVAVVPGRNVIGIELPNAKRETVGLRELLGSEAFERYGGKLTLALGKDISGAPFFVDLARMPHLLIAGTTGSGKSVGINGMILSLLYQLSPDICKFILIDPKMLELSVYDGIPHLLTPVVTEPGKAVVALKWTVREMEERYRAMSQLGVRNVAGYNARIAEAKRTGETLVRRVQTGFEDDGRPVFEEQELDLEALPFIVVVVDEMADLMLVAGKDIEAAVQRLAQMARAAGIHLIMATQRPSVDVITGTIKANFPTRISFQVTSKIDSRTILGEQGAEQLLGQGDMLYMAPGGRVTRVHGPFVSDDEVEGLVSFLKQQGEPAYVPAVTEAEDDAPFGFDTGGGGGIDGDDLYDEAVALVARDGKASTSYVQRRLQIGYNRAARIIERMEAEGVVSKPDRVGRREVLVADH